HVAPELDRALRPERVDERVADLDGQRDRQPVVGAGAGDRVLCGPRDLFEHAVAIFGLKGANAPHRDARPAVPDGRPVHGRCDANRSQRSASTIRRSKRGGFEYTLAAMSRPRTLVLVGPLLGFVLGLGGCRADDEQCRDLARHIVEIADAEGKSSSAATAVALEGDCKTVRPTRRLVDCMMKARTLAELDAC